MLIGPLAYTIPSGGRSRTLSQAHQQPAAGVYQSKAARVVRECVMYFGPGTTSDSLTLNIRSQNVSGACESSCKCDRLIRA
jgi:hypothetical protein